MQNPIPYPCKDCSRANKDRFCEHKKCKAYREWLKIEWRLACEPFRRIKREQEQRGNK